MKRMLTRVQKVNGLRRLIGAVLTFISLSAYFTIHPSVASEATSAAPAATEVISLGPPKPDLAKGKQLYEQGDAARGIIACVSCHGVAGNSSIPANPSLSAQPHEYLVKQLLDFKLKKGAKAPERNGAGGNPTIMTVNVTPLTPTDMQDLAYYLSLQPVKDPASAGYKNRMQWGQKIWRAGLPERELPACASCHGATGAGIPGQYPRLSGQFPSYIEEQLKLFRSGDRLNSIPMHTIADRMSDKDIQAVSDYAAGLR